MYRSFFEMERMPFVRDVPIQELYESPAMSEALGRLAYAADRQLFAVCILRLNSATFSEIQST